MIRLETRWDQPLDSLIGDFSAVDGSTSPALVESIGPTSYRLIHQVPSPVNLHDGTGRAVVVRATNDSSQTTVVNAVELCLSDTPPRHVSTVLTNRSDYGHRGGDSLYIETRWCADDSLDLTVELDARAIAPGFEPDDARVIQREIGPCPLFRIGWRIPLQAEDRAPDGGNLVLRVNVRDSGCGTGTVANVAIALDTKGPEVVPTLEPVPSETTADSLRIGGAAPGSDGVAILLNDELFTRVAVDPLTQRFTATVPLEPDRINRIAVWGEDLVGNRTRTTPPLSIARVVSRGLEFPRPFLRGEDEILLRDPEGLGQASVELFDLAGVRLRRWGIDPGHREFRTVWDGRDETGVRAGQGLYLVRARWRAPGALERESTRVLLMGE